MSNLAQYIDDVRLYVGDLAGTEFSDSIILLSLENSIQYLQRYWGTKYLLYGSGIVNTSATPIAGYTAVNTPDGVVYVLSSISEGDVFRNTYVTFISADPPTIEQQDLPAVLITASYLLRRAKASNSTAGVSWSTPDLTYSNIQSSKMYLDLMKQDLEALTLFFKAKLGRIQLGRFVYQDESFDTMSAIDQANWFLRLARQQNYNKG